MHPVHKLPRDATAASTNLQALSGCPCSYVILLRDFYPSVGWKSIDKHVSCGYGFELKQFVGSGSPVQWFVGRMSTAALIEPCHCLHADLAGQCLAGS